MNLIEYIIFKNHSINRRNFLSWIKNREIQKVILEYLKDLYKRYYIYKISVCYKKKKERILGRPVYFSKYGADKQWAYSGYLGITVQQYYFIHHKIRLSHPSIPCIGFEMARRKGKSHIAYFPFELLDV
jgi:hypothetical protein